MKFNDRGLDTGRRPGLRPNAKRVDLAVLPQQLAGRGNREHAVVKSVPGLVTFHMADKNCDAVPTGQYASMSKPNVRLGCNPVGADDFGKCVPSRDELGRHNPLRTSVRRDLNASLDQSLVVREVAGSRSKMEERDPQFVCQQFTFVRYPCLIQTSGGAC